MANPPPLSLVAKALLAVAPAVEASILAMALSQSIGEGSWSAWTENGATFYPFEGTNNFGAIHATDHFAQAYENGGQIFIHATGAATAQSYGYDSGWGMVAMLDHNPAPYIARMAVYPSLIVGASAFLALITKYVDLANVKDVKDYSAQLYVHNYYEGFAPNRTLVQNRAAAYANGAWSDDDQANISAYANIIASNLASAKSALAAASGELGDPTLPTHGPPFASLGLRLTPAGKVYDHTGMLVAGAPHTVAHARAILGAAAVSPPNVNAISLADAMAAPAGDGVWMFPQGVAAPETDVSAPPAPVSLRAAEEGVGVAAVVGTVLGIAASVAIAKWKPGWIPRFGAPA